MFNAAMKIGLISDTHGLLRPQAISALEGSELIIHAGDIGQREIIEQLSAVAPVVAIRGNVDKGEWALQLPLTAVIEVHGASIYVLHNIEELDLDPAAAGFNIVVSGHSHKPKKSEQPGVMYLNPGSAGPRRFQLPITLGRLDLRQSPWKMEIIDLSEKG